MNQRFSVKETFHDYRLEDNITGLDASMGDGVDVFLDEAYDEFVGTEPERNSFPEIGTEDFRVAWEDEVNKDTGEYFEAYFPRLDGLVIYDNDKTMDRYTVLVEPASLLERSLHAGKDLWVCLGLSVNCDSPQGFSQWGFAVPGKRLGGIIHFLELPGNVQKHVVEMLEEGKDE